MGWRITRQLLGHTWPPGGSGGAKLIWQFLVTFLNISWMPLWISLKFCMKLPNGMTDHQTAFGPYLTPWWVRGAKLIWQFLAFLVIFLNIFWTPLWISLKFCMKLPNGMTDHQTPLGLYSTPWWVRGAKLIWQFLAFLLTFLNISWTPLWIKFSVSITSLFIWGLSDEPHYDGRIIRLPRSA